ncbi:MAG: RDD family protein [Clostridia bacterium]|nr:RDD family protein [Clostridia bacterium]
MLDLQKANMFKRISAAIFDFILLITLTVGFMWGTSALLNYNSYSEKIDDRHDYYFHEKHGFDESTQYDKLTDEEKERYKTAETEFYDDKEVNYALQMMFNLSLIIVTFPTLFAFLILEFIVPLLFKNGQTLGKKIFGIAVMRVDGVRVNGVLMFARSILGKFTVGTMLPILAFMLTIFGVLGMVGIIIVGGILFTQIVLILFTKARTPIHDKLAQTVTVDMASQMIFDTPEELMAYKNKLQAENADKAAY